MKQRSRIALTLLFTASLVLAACGGGPEIGEDETWLGTPKPGTATDTATATHPASPGGTAVVPDVSAGTTLLVLLEDGSIAVQEQSVPPGPAVLTIENRGTDVHNLFVEGPGVRRAAGDPIPAGGSASAPVTFQPGTYTFYCPILDHRQNGEQISVTVAR